MSLYCQVSWWHARYKVSSPVTMFSRCDGSWSNMEMKPPEKSIRFAFCSSVSLCGTNREQIIRLPKSSRKMVCAVSLLMPNSFAINLVPAFVSLSRSFLGFCLSMADQNVAHPQSFPSLHQSVWTICKHIFCSRLPSRTPAPKFHASPLQFSPICSRSWCLHVASLQCDTTSHTDYVQQAAVGLHCRSHAANVFVKLMSRNPVIRKILNTPSMIFH